MQDYLIECLNSTREMVKSLISVQEAYINTHHPEFICYGDSIMSMFEPEVFNKKM